VSSPSSSATADRFPRVDAQSRFVIPVAVASWALVAWTVLTTIWVMRLAHSSLPLFDAWDYWRSYPALHHDFWRIFDQHNEHRIFVPRIFYLIDQFVFSGRDLFLLTAIFLIQSGHALLLWRAGCRSVRWRAPDTYVLLAATVVPLVSAQQFTNLATGFQIPFVAVFFAAACAFFCLDAARRADVAGEGRRSAVWLGVATLSAVAATGSLANGLLVWPFLAGLSLWFRLPRRHTALIATAGALCWVLYFHNYHQPPQNASPLTALSSLSRVFAFATATLGTPVTDLVTATGSLYGIWDPVPTLWASAAGVVGLWLAWRGVRACWNDQTDLGPIRAVLACELLFTITAVFAIAAGRVMSPMSEAINSRYATPALIFWSLVILLGWSYGRRRAELDARRTVATLLFLSVAIAIQQPQRIRFAVRYAVDVHRAIAAVAANVQDDEVLGHIYYAPAAIWDPVRYFQRTRKSIYAEDWTQWYGTPITDHYRLVGRAWRGQVEPLAAINAGPHAGWRASGWAWDGHRQSHVGQVVLVGDDRRIIGFGSYGIARPDVLAVNRDLQDENLGWVGYFGSAVRPHILAAYLVDDDGETAMPIGSVPAPDKRP
jgi:hypothetical protein